jgi:hypothetical protein
MNERIRLLAEQAFFDDTSSQPSDRMYTFSDHKMQQFAELLLKDCASNVEAWEKDSRNHISYMLKNHYKIDV